MNEPQDPWAEVLREAAESIAAPPLVGTKFRGLVSEIASKRGLTFPPPEEPLLKFIQLLQRHPDVVAILRRPGQDFLVSPAEKQELLGQERQFGIRRDFFQAFTTVTASVVFLYDKANDEVVAHGGHDGDAGLIPIPPVTLAAEIALRRAFAEKLPEESPERAVLLQALEAKLPLQQFGMAVRDAQLQREWHGHRTAHVMQRIQQWAQAAEVPWRDAWLTEHPQRWHEVLSDRLPATKPGVAAALREVLPGLDAADLHRISVPLDLVLKIVAASRQAK